MLGGIEEGRGGEAAGTIDAGPRPAEEGDTDTLGGGKEAGDSAGKTAAGRDDGGVHHADRKDDAKDMAKAGTEKENVGSKMDFEGAGNGLARTEDLDWGLDGAGLGNAKDFGTGNEDLRLRGHDHLGQDPGDLRNQRDAGISSGEDDTDGDQGDNDDDDDDDLELEDFSQRRGRNRSESFVNELEDQVFREKQDELQRKVQAAPVPMGNTFKVAAGGPPGVLGNMGGLGGLGNIGGGGGGGMSSYNSMEDFEPFIKTQLSAKTLEIITNLDHTKYNARLKQSGSGLFPSPVVSMSAEEAEEESRLEKQPLNGPYGPATASSTNGKGASSRRYGVALGGQRRGSTGNSASGSSTSITGKYRRRKRASVTGTLTGNSSSSLSTAATAASSSSGKRNLPPTHKLGRTSSSSSTSSSTSTSTARFAPAPPSTPPPPLPQDYNGQSPLHVYIQKHHQQQHQDPKRYEYLNEAAPIPSGTAPISASTPTFDEGQSTASSLTETSENVDPSTVITSSASLGAVGTVVDTTVPATMNSAPSSESAALETPGTAGGDEEMVHGDVQGENRVATSSSTEAADGQQSQPQTMTGTPQATGAADTSTISVTMAPSTYAPPTRAAPTLTVDTKAKATESHAVQTSRGSSSSHHQLIVKNRKQLTSGRRNKFRSVLYSMFPMCSKVDPPPSRSNSELSELGDVGTGAPYDVTKPQPQQQHQLHGSQPVATTSLPPHPLESVASEDDNASVMSGRPEGSSVCSSDQNLDRYDHHIKILLLGDSGVGKTSLMLRFADNQFQPNLMSTAGVDFKVRYLEDPVMTQNKRIKCQIWDTAGQERFHVITHTYYRGAHGIALVYDAANEQSFQQISYWMNNIRSHAGSDARVMVFGNKVDLPSRVISPEQGRAAAEKYGAQFYETSAKLGTNVLEAFEALSMDAVACLEARKPLPGDKRSPASARGGVRIDSRKSTCLLM